MEKKYLLRVWGNGVPEKLWQASLKNIETKEIEFFADIESFRKYFSNRNSTLDILSGGEFKDGSLE